MIIRRSAVDLMPDSETVSPPALPSLFDASSGCVDELSFYPFGEGAILHRPGSQKIWVLNVSSAVLWCLLGEVETVQELVAAYAHHFELTLQCARRDVSGILTEFSIAGLLADEGYEGRSAGPPVIPGLTTFPVPIEDVSLSECPDWSGTLKLDDFCFQLRCRGASVAEQVRAFWGHLEAKQEYPQIVIDIAETESGCNLSFNGQSWFLKKKELLPGLLSKLFQLFSARQNHRLLLHAAVVTQGNFAVLIPGETGVGKSTLVAALGAHGWKVYSDELAPLDPLTLTVFPCPFPVGVKQESLPAVTRVLPKVAYVRGYTRDDGRRVRYLAPPLLNVAVADGAPLPVVAAVFPCHHESSKPVLTRLSSFASLQQLACVGSSPRPLLPDDIQALLKLAGQVPCFSLDYSCLAEALELLEQILATLELKV